MNDRYAGSAWPDESTGHFGLFINPACKARFCRDPMLELARYVASAGVVNVDWIGPFRIRISESLVDTGCFVMDCRASQSSICVLATAAQS